VVGRVLATLEHSGAADRTLVIFTSDNGCARPSGTAELEQKRHYPSGPLRGYKADAWEGGHRIPFIARWPGVVKAATTCDQLVEQVDFMATLADIFGAKLPENVGEDSVSLLPLLKGENRPVRKNAVNTSVHGVPAVRQGAWKLILEPEARGRGKGKASSPVQLYNLAEDLGETKNLAAAEPRRVAEMQALLEKLISAGRSTPGARQNNDVEVRRYAQELRRTLPGKSDP
jgi:arylsulfatase A